MKHEKKQFIKLLVIISLIFTILVVLIALNSCDKNRIKQAQASRISSDTLTISEVDSFFKKLNNHQNGSRKIK